MTIIELANEYVRCTEDEYSINTWKAWAIYNMMAEQSRNPEEQMIADETMDELSKEIIRTSPDGPRAIDHEDVWRYTGEYIRYTDTKKE